MALTLFKNKIFNIVGVSVVFFMISSVEVVVGKNNFKNEENINYPVIKEIFVEGSKYIKRDAIISRLPYKKDGVFNPDVSGEAIDHLYSLGFFRQIQIEKEDINDKEINLYIVVEERKLLESITFKGNKILKSKRILEKLNLEKLETIDEEQLKKIALTIQRLYKEENYHLSKVNFEIETNKENPDKASVIFNINEGAKAKIKRVYFKGNKRMPSRKLRTFLFTQEEWLLGFLGDAGKYSEDAIDMDKKRIEYFYRDYGYLMAKVADVHVEFSKNEKEIFITFDIREGDQFLIRYISVPGDDLFDESELLQYVELESGKPYSQTKLVKSINQLKSQWGNIGYIYADVYPQVVPNEETKEVDVTFYVEKGKKMYVNRINITGNKVTKDRVVRREFSIEEGDLITSKKLTESKEGVEYLGFFDRGAVNWKIHKISDIKADLEMNVKEAKTGKLNLAASYGSDQTSVARSLKGSVQLEKSNFLGQGWDIGAQVQANFKRVQNGTIYFFDPHLFDSDISAGFNMYAKQEEYDQWANVSPTPLERTVGGSARFGFLLPWLSKRTEMSVELGAEYIRNNKPRAHGYFSDLFQPIVDRTFQSGDHVWLGIDLAKDTRNHRVYPNHGYKILAHTKIAPPGLNKEFSFFKAELDWSWYTPLIDEDWLVLMLHGKAGLVNSISSNKVIPYKELFHMGGQTTVRGFVWGSIGPAWNPTGGDSAGGDPLGGRKAIQFNAELIFPLIPDYSMKAHFFYDAGAGWDTSKKGISNMSFIKRNKFNLRHSVGFGLNLLKPYPAKIDWGYKLDRDKKAGESPHEFHISMNAAW